MDWLFATRLGDFFTEFDYQYWPFSRWRWAGLAALMSAAIYTWSIRGKNGPLLALTPGAILIVVYVVTVLVDLYAQRRAGYRKPARYSDGDY